MLSFEITAEDVIVNRIRSRLRTLRGYRDTSMIAHGRLTASVFTLASSLATEVNELATDHPDLREVQRWAGKFNEYTKQHNLIQEPTKDKKNGKASHSQDTLFADTGQDVREETK